MPFFYPKDVYLVDGDEALDLVDCYLSHNVISTVGLAEYPLTRAERKKEEDSQEIHVTNFMRKPLSISLHAFVGGTSFKRDYGYNAEPEEPYYRPLTNIVKVWNTLLEHQSSGRILSLQTPEADYADLVIKKITREATIMEGSALQCRIELQQIVFNIVSPMVSRPDSIESAYRRKRAIEEGPYLGPLAEPDQPSGLYNFIERNFIRSSLDESLRVVNTGPAIIEALPGLEYETDAQGIKKEEFLNINRLHNQSYTYLPVHEPGASGLTSAIGVSEAPFFYLGNDVPSTLSLPGDEYIKKRDSETPVGLSPPLPVADDIYDETYLLTQQPTLSNEVTTKPIYMQPNEDEIISSRSSGVQPSDGNGNGNGNGNGQTSDGNGNGQPSDGNGNGNGQTSDGNGNGQPSDGNGNGNGQTPLRSESRQRVRTYKVGDQYVREVWEDGEMLNKRTLSQEESKEYTDEAKKFQDRIRNRFRNRRTGRITEEEFNEAQSEQIDSIRENFDKEWYKEQEILSYSQNLQKEGPSKDKETTERVDRKIGTLTSTPSSSGTVSSSSLMSADDFLGFVGP